MRLIIKLFIPLFALFLVLISYAKWNWLPKLTDFTKQQHYAQLQVHLTSIGESLVPLLLQEQLGNIHDTLDSLLTKNATWLQLKLYNTEGRLLYPLNAKTLPEAEEHLLLLRHPINISTRKIAQLELVVDISTELEAIELLEQKFFIALLIFLVFTAASIAAMLELIVSRPLARLSQASEELARDNYAVALPTARDDEVGHLVRHFHRMRMALNNYKNQVEQEIEGHKKTTKELVEQKEQLAFHASHDALTGLINRREFETRLTTAIDRASKDNLEHTVIFIDLDRFKIVNDSCGHLAGDELLKQISTLIRRHIRTSDSVARLGGDEFAILLEFCSLPIAIKKISSLHKVLQNFIFDWNSQIFNIGASIGVATITQQSTNVELVLAQADQACYTAKKLGRNRYYVYEANNDSAEYAKQELKSVTRVIKALENEQFILYGQPIVSVLAVQKPWHHFEVLVRMQDDDGQLIMPGDFIPLAERYNLMTKVDRWVVKNALEYLDAAQQTGMGDLKLSINLSGPSMSDTELLPYIKQQLSSFNVKPQSVCFEITETTAVYDLSNAQKLIGELKTHGCEFALDDFGSGFSSFAYLKNLPVDYLKIDGVFVRDVANDPISEALLKSIHQIGKVFGMKTIAEFVEDDVALNIIRNIGVDYAQGYGIAKPDELRLLLSPATSPQALSCIKNHS